MFGSLVTYQPVDGSINFHPPQPSNRPVAWSSLMATHISSSVRRSSTTKSCGKNRWSMIWTFERWEDFPVEAEKKKRSLFKAHIMDHLE